MMWNPTSLRRIERTVLIWRKNSMRAITQPPPSSRCDQCGGELRLKMVETANRGLALAHEIFACANCGGEQSLIVSRAKIASLADHIPRSRAANQHPLAAQSKMADAPTIGSLKTVLKLSHTRVMPMEEFVHQQNLVRYRKMLSETTHEITAPNNLGAAG